MTKDGVNDVLKASTKWPPEPSREVLQYYQSVVDTAWSKLERGYSHLETKLSVKADKGKDPAVLAEVSYTGAFRGGKSYELRPGDTIAGIAKAEYATKAMPMCSGRPMRMSLANNARSSRPVLRSPCRGSGCQLGLTRRK